MRRALSFLVLTLFVCGFYSASVAQSFPFRNVKVGDPIPSAEVVDILTGKTENIRNLAGNGVSVFLFWGADSRFKKKHSQKVLIGLMPLEKELSVKVYPINVQRDPDDVVKAFLSEVGYTGPAWVDKNKEVYRALGIFVMPSVIITKNGKIFKGFGYTHDLSEVVKAYVEVALGLKTQKQVEAELNPQQKELPPEEKEALRYYRLGATMLERGMVNRAEEAFRKAINVKKDYVDAYVGLGIVLLQEGKAEELAEVLKFLESKSPDDFRVKVIKARYYLLKGKPDEALDIANSLLFSKPGSPDVYVLLGDIYSKKGDWEKAASYYRKALDKYYNLGRLLQE
ncbi:MAG: tetratricopeptide repeat protein [Deferribacteres bacterium]|nr:tetratricopeptide repeat protein [Deferribacteres bacterium]